MSTHNICFCRETKFSVGKKNKKNTSSGAMHNDLSSIQYTLTIISIFFFFLSQNWNINWSLI